MYSRTLVSDKFQDQTGLTPVHKGPGRCSPLADQPQDAHHSPDSSSFFLKLVAIHKGYQSLKYSHIQLRRVILSFWIIINLYMTQT